MPNRFGHNNIPGSKLRLKLTPSPSDVTQGFSSYASSSAAGQAAPDTNASDNGRQHRPKRRHSKNKKNIPNGKSKRKTKTRTRTKNKGTSAAKPNDLTRLYELITQDSKAELTNKAFFTCPEFCAADDKLKLVYSPIRVYLSASEYQALPNYFLQYLMTYTQLQHHRLFAEFVLDCVLTTFDKEYATEDPVKVELLRKLVVTEARLAINRHGADKGDTRDIFADFIGELPNRLKSNLLSMPSVNIYQQKFKAYAKGIRDYQKAIAQLAASELTPSAANCSSTSSTTTVAISLASSSTSMLWPKHIPSPAAIVKVVEQTFITNVAAASHLEQLRRNDDNITLTKQRAAEDARVLDRDCRQHLHSLQYERMCEKSRTILRNPQIQAKFLGALKTVETLLASDGDTALQSQIAVWRKLIVQPQDRITPAEVGLLKRLGKHLGRLAKKLDAMDANVNLPREQQKYDALCTRESALTDACNVLSKRYELLIMLAETIKTQDMLAARPECAQRFAALGDSLEVLVSLSDGDHALDSKQVPQLYYFRDTLERAKQAYDVISAELPSEENLAGMLNRDDDTSNIELKAWMNQYVVYDLSRSTEETLVFEAQLPTALLKWCAEIDARVAASVTSAVARAKPLAPQGGMNEVTNSGSLKTENLSLEQFSQIRKALGERPQAEQAVTPTMATRVTTTATNFDAGDDNTLSDSEDSIESLRLGL